MLSTRRSSVGATLVRSISNNELPVVPDVVFMPLSNTSMAKLVSRIRQQPAVLGVRIMSLNRSSPSSTAGDLHPDVRVQVVDASIDRRDRRSRRDQGAPN
jgi:hypothetical protein